MREVVIDPDGVVVDSSIRCRCWAVAVEWGMIDVNPAKHGVNNPQRRRTEKRPFESWAQLAKVASRLGDGERALVIFAAAAGLRPGEWIALEQRDIDRAARVVYVRRAFRNGRIECPKTEGSIRALPLNAGAVNGLKASRAPRSGRLSHSDRAQSSRAA